MTLAIVSAMRQELSALLGCLEGAQLVHAGGRAFHRGRLAGREVVLVLSSLALALAVGVVVELVLCWALGPGWSSSLGLMAVLAGLSWSLADRFRNERD